VHRLPPYRIYVPDPVSQQVGYLGVMQAEGQPVEVASRLKLQDSKISAAEQLIARGLREASLPKPCEAPCAQHCLRRENGMQATGNPPPQTPGRGTLGAMGCAAQLDTKSMRYIDSIDNRRVEIADTQAGLLFGLLQFRHSTRSTRSRQRSSWRPAFPRPVGSRPGRLGVRGCRRGKKKRPA